MTVADIRNIAAANIFLLCVTELFGTFGGTKASFFRDVEAALFVAGVFILLMAVDTKASILSLQSITLVP